MASAIFQAKAQPYRKILEKVNQTARVMTFDVTNDLAVLQLTSSVDGPLFELRKALPANGANGFSVGKPRSFECSIEALIGNGGEIALGRLQDIKGVLIGTGSNNSVAMLVR